MKTIHLLTVFTFAILSGFTQVRNKVEEFVEKGIELHDKGHYQAALRKYDKALEVEKENFLALAEKALTLQSMGRYSESVECCQRALAVHGRHEGVRTVYVFYGNALDMLNRPEESLAMYDSGLVVDPDFYELHFNKGVTLARMGKLKEGLACFQHSACCNPKHPGTQNSIARVLDLQNSTIPAILAYCRFFILEAGTLRSSQNLSNLKELLSTRPGEKSESGSSTEQVSGVAAGAEENNPFENAELCLALTGLQDLTLAGKESDVQWLVRKLDAVLGSLATIDKAQSGFIGTYYMPYFSALHGNGFTPTLAYLILRNSGSDPVSKWIKSHPEDIRNFYNWSRNFEWNTSLEGK